MSYHEQAAPPALAPWLACTWARRADDARPARILPDGCIDIVWIEGAGVHVAGPNRTAFVVSLEPGTRALGARFRPGAAAALLGVSAGSVLDGRLPIGEAWGDEGARLEEALAIGDDRLAQLAQLRRALLVRAARSERPDPLVHELVARLARPRVPLAGIARELGVSERQLRRRVSAAVGYGPKRLARVLRLLAAVEAARRGDELARVAFEAGFSDQAHFTNECRELAGVPPGALLVASPAVSCKTPERGRAMIAG